MSGICKCNESDIFQTTVKNVIWNLSTDGILVPSIQIDPTIFNFFRITKATAYNAKYIKENGIGPGSIVNVAANLNYIPHVSIVIKSCEPEMPKMSYEWTSDGINIIPKK